MNAKFAFGLAVAAMTSAALGNVTGANGPVTLDGKLDEACWKAAEWQGDFKVASRQAATSGNVARKPKGETQFAIVTDAENLYVGIRAEHKSMKEMCALPVGGQWASEAVELHLVPTGGEFELYQFLVCHPGQMWAMFYSEGGHIRPDPYGPAWERAIADSETGWTAEVKIPFSALYMTRNGNWAKTWRLNVGRTYKTARNGLGENSSWADVAANYSELSKFRDYGPFPMRRAEDDFLVTDLLLQLLDRLLDPARKLPVGLAAADLEEEVAEDLVAVLRVDDFRMELDRVEALRLVADRRVRAVAARRRDLEALRDLRDAVAMAHPDDELVGEALEELVARLDRHLGLAVLAPLARLHLAAEFLAHELHAVADAEHGEPEVEDAVVNARRPVLEHAVGAAREDDALRHVLAELRRGRVETDDLREDLLLTDATRDELRVLRTVVENDDTLELAVIGSHGGCVVEMLRC